MRIAIRLTVLLSLLLGSVTVAAGVASAEGEMSKEQAGQLYATADCQRAVSARRFVYAMFRNSNTVSLRQTRNRLPAIKRAARYGSSAEYTFVRALKNPPAPWPADVQSPVATLSQLHLQVSGLYGRLSVATTARGVFYWFKRLETTANKTDVPARAVRADLDLPLFGPGC